jgi:hypothetical protein
MDLCFYPLELSEESKQTIIKMRPALLGEIQPVQWNSKIVLVARIGKGFVGVDVPVMIKELSFRGKLRVQIELMNDLPLLKQVQLTFMEQPKIDFILKPLKAFDLMDLPGLSNWLMGTINDNVEAQLVNPNMITINIAGTIEKIKTGVLKIKINGTQGIRFPDGAEPFIRIELNGKVRGKTPQAKGGDEDIRGKFYILTKSLDKPLKFVLMANKEQVLGTASFPLDMLIDNSNPLEELGASVLDAKGEPLGRVNFHLKYARAEDILDPEADLSSETGVFSVKVKKGMNILPVAKSEAMVYAEMWVHPKKVEIDPGTHVYTDADPHCYRTGTFKAVAGEPLVWEGEPEWEVYLDRVSRTQITLMVREAEGGQVLCHWSGPVKKLLNRSDRFAMLDGDGKVDLAFGFQPTDEEQGSELAADNGAAREPAIGVVRVKVVGAAGLPDGSTAYYVVAERGETEIGRTPKSLETGSPVFNRPFMTMVSATSETIGLDVYSKDLFKDSLVGGLDFPVAFLAEHPNEYLQQEARLKDKKGKPMEARLTYEAGFFPTAGSSPERKVLMEGAEAYPVVPSVLPEGCNCAILAAVSVSVRGVGLAHQERALAVQLQMEEADEAFVSTGRARAAKENGALVWRCHGETLIRQEGAFWGELNVRLVEARTIGADDVLGSVRVAVADAQCNQWLRMGGEPGLEVMLRVHAKPLRLVLPTEAQNVGTLTVNLVSATELLAVDDGGTSDPFAVFRVGTAKVYKSEVVKRCLEPSWEETFETPIRHRDRDVLSLELRDWNRVALSRTLGQVSVDLGQLPLGEWEEFLLPLENVSTGRVRFRLRFVPSGGLASKAKNAIVGAPANVVGGVATGAKAVGGAAATGVKAVGGGVATGAKAVGGGVMAVGGGVATGFKAVGGGMATGAKAVFGLGKDKEKAPAQAPAPTAAPKEASEDNNNNNNNDNDNEEEEEDAPEVLSIRFVRLVVAGLSKPFDSRIKVKHLDRTIFKSPEIKHSLAPVFPEGKDASTFLVPEDTSKPIKFELHWDVRGVDPSAPEVVFDPTAMKVIEEREESVLASLPFAIRSPAGVKAEIVFEFGEASKALIRKHSGSGGPSGMFSSLKGKIKQ